MADRHGTLAWMPADDYLNTGVVDELRLHLVPIPLGAGVRLFTRDQQPAAFALLPGVAEDAGVVHLRYGFNAV
ncbi:MAG TPA: hypothetical protein VGJ53_21050 [Micromonosporaceae bacterium]|jgi:hypothetical protein